MKGNVKFNESGAKKEKWDGGCVDTGAQTTVIYLAQAEADCRFTKAKFRPKMNNNRYRFGNDRQNSLGLITVRIPIGKHIVVIEKVDVVNANAPFLIGLDFPDKYRMYIDTVRNKLFPELRNRNAPCT